MNYLDIKNVLGPHPRIATPLSANDKKNRSYKKFKTNEQKVMCFVNSYAFQGFCEYNKIVDGSLLQIAVGSEFRAYPCGDGDDDWVCGFFISFGGAFDNSNVKAPRFVKRLSWGEHKIYYAATFWVKRDENGYWEAEMLIDGESFLSGSASKQAFAKTAECLQLKLAQDFVAKLDCNGKKSFYRVALAKRDDGKDVYLLISFDNGMLFEVLPETVIVEEVFSDGIFAVLRTDYNWFRNISGNDFVRI